VPVFHVRCNLAFGILNSFKVPVQGVASIARARRLGYAAMKQYRLLAWFQT
jgi:hypothetical protein